jgi:hypothetical protein
VQAELTKTLNDTLMRIMGATCVIDDALAANPELSTLSASRLLVRLDALANRLERLQDDLDPPTVMAAVLGNPDAPDGVLARLSPGDGAATETG